MLSLNSRLLIAASIALAAFLGLTGLALDRAFRESALTAVQERLQTQVYMLLGVADLDAAQRLGLPNALPEARLSQPDSGLYAQVISSEGSVVWRSQSIVGRAIPFPETHDLGEPYFQSVTASDGSPLFALSFTVSWEVKDHQYRRYTFQVAETQQGFYTQVNRFRRSLGGWLLAMALVLLAVQGIILRWGLRPLRQVAQEVAEIEAGRRTELAGSYPRELRRLTENLNALIHHSHAHLERYRNALGDLAHSLKTPLAVLRSTVESGPPADHSGLREQIERMNQTVDYQLQRAAASGRIALAAPVPVEPLARKLMDSLAKVYADKSLRLNLQVEGSTEFLGDEGDLMEILGNLGDNACKWARSRVDMRVFRCRASSGQGETLVLEVEDDGPGIPVDRRRAILNRGERADPFTPGHGIGLAVVRDLVEEIYQGSLEIDNGALGGARIQVRLRL